LWAARSPRRTRLSRNRQLSAPSLTAFLGTGSRTENGQCAPLRKKKVSPETIAAWMVDEFKRQGGVLYQSDAAAKIEELFGEQLFRLEGGIDPKVLKAFQKLTGNSVVWD
jgi:hypothetical protein